MELRSKSIGGCGDWIILFIRGGNFAAWLRARIPPGFFHVVRGCNIVGTTAGATWLGDPGGVQGIELACCGNRTTWAAVTVPKQEEFKTEGRVRQ